MTTDTSEQDGKPGSLRRTVGLFVLIALAAVLLTVLFLRAGSVSHDIHHQYTLDLRSLREADAEIDAEVLASRLELSRNYDALTAHVQRAARFSERIAGVPEFLGDGDRVAVKAAAREMQALVREKILLVDHFKRDSAVLRNSLAYFPAAVNAYFGARHDAAVGQAVGRYARHLLAYARVPDADGLGLANASARSLRAAAVGGDERRVVSNLLRHGEVISARLASVDALSQQLLKVDSARRLETLNQLYGESYARAESEAERYRILLYVLALASTAYLALTFLRLDRA
ncbi:MAG: hypothetical protein HZC22_00115, partial [Rhodocyclales bacterium]|nr:hypothetical protein [Rhodocyclales bacterium]